MSKYQKTIFLSGVHGQYKLWKSEIAKACNSADEVIQLGNIIGCNDFVKDHPTRGANEAILKFLILYKTTQNHWTQIVGTNEIAALNFPEEWTNAESRQILRKAWLSNKPTFFTAAVNKNRLVTHGGLTYGEWLAIDMPQTAAEAAQRLNDKYQGTIYQGECFKVGKAPNFAANPIWADAIMEFYPSWLTAPVPMPFDQVHGASSLNNIEARALISEKTSPLHYFDKVRFKSYGSVVTIKGMEVTAIDLELPGKLITTIPQPQTLYIEKMEVK